MPLFWFSLASITGIFLSSIFNISMYIWVFGCLVFLIAGFYEYKIIKTKNKGLLSRSVFRIPLAFLFLGLFIGGYRYQRSLPVSLPTNPLGYVNTKEPVHLLGIIKSHPIKTTDTISAVINTEAIIIDGKNKPITGDLSLFLPSGFNIKYGDRVELLGTIQRTYQEYSQITSSNLAIQQVFTKMYFPQVTILSYGNGNRIIDFIYNIRERAHAIIFNLIPFPESAVLSGILLGMEGEIPEYLWDGYRSSGTVHIIAISGFNITIIALLAFQFFKSIFGWKWTLPLTIGMVLFYTVLVGADPPVVRAAIMGSVAMTAHYIGRRSIGMHSLVLTAIIMMMGNPFLLWSVSFQLSFLATLALLTMVEPINKWVSDQLENHFSSENVSALIPVISILTTTFSATLVIAPILYVLTPNISLVSLFANFLIAPLQPLIMILGGCAVILGFLIPPSFNMMRFIVWPLVAFCDQIALRLSLSSSAVIGLPKFIFWISLAISIITLSYFSFRSFVSLLHPTADVSES